MRESSRKYQSRHGVHLGQLFTIQPHGSMFLNDPSPICDLLNVGLLYAANQHKLTMAINIAHECESMLYISPKRGNPINPELIPLHSFGENASIRYDGSTSCTIGVTLYLSVILPPVAGGCLHIVLPHPLAFDFVAINRVINYWSSIAQYKPSPPTFW
mmetsp:Transcript_13153/g.29691  ORF Transcript_13153/g.29691 Transcript_13153/m.29691 type:complete len:158 (-) Transcript_13153:290-763(-)